MDARYLFCAISLLAGCSSVEIKPTTAITEAEIVPYTQSQSACIPEIELKSDNIDVDLFEFDLREALLEIALLSETTIIADERLSGLITIQAETTLANLLAMITSAGDYGYKVYPDYVLVSVSNDPKIQTLCNYKPAHLSADDLMSMLPTYQEFINVRANQLTISAPKNIQNQIHQALKLYDVDQGQIVLELSVIEVSREALKVLGIPTQRSPYTTTRKSLLKIFQALEVQGEAYIKAMPSVRVANGKEAKFESLTTAWLDHMINYSNRRESVQYGVQMNIIPRITGSTVSLEIIKASVSDLDRDKEELTRHEVSTSVSVNNGEYLVIGGLLQKKSKQLQKGFPFIQLFDQSQSDVTEVLIMIRPRVG